MRLFGFGRPCPTHAFRLDLTPNPYPVHPPHHPHQQQYDKYFGQNEPGKGGSFYLQSKIYRAKECLEREIEAERKKANAAKADADKARRGNGGGGGDKGSSAP